MSVCITVYSLLKGVSKFMKVKKYLTFIASLLVFKSSFALQSIEEHESFGFCVGRISKISNEIFSNNLIVKLLLGNEPSQIIDIKIEHAAKNRIKEKKIILNPFTLIFENENNLKDERKNQLFEKNSVVVKYKTISFKKEITHASPFLIEDVEPINKINSLEICEKNKNLSKDSLSNLHIISGKVIKLYNKSKKYYAEILSGNKKNNNAIIKAAIEENQLPCLFDYLKTNSLAHIYIIEKKIQTPFNNPHITLFKILPNTMESPIE